MTLRRIDWEERKITSKLGLEERARLLESRRLAAPGGEDCVLGLYEDDRLIATGSLVGNTLQGIATERDSEGEGAASAIVSSLVKKAFELGRRQIFVFTKSSDALRFEAMGFSLLASALPADEGERSARTKSHGEEGAARNSPWVYALVVEKDKSLFPVETRLKLVRDGTSDIPNITVLAGGPYVISSATFPTYFIKPATEDKGQAISKLHAALDLELFKRHIAPALGVAVRYVGTEPFCPTTAMYNAAMKMILASADARSSALEVREVERYRIDGEPVSASKVREAIRAGRIEDARKLVPESTWKWLSSSEAAPILEKIRRSSSRH